MWANAQRDGRPLVPSVQRRKVWLTPTTRVPCSNVKAVEICRAKFANRSQPLGGRRSPYYEDMWGRYRRLTSFFRLSIRASAAKTQPDKVVRW